MREEARACGDVCDGEMHECWSCGGDGYVLGDCFEDSCPCANPEEDHDLEECDICRGEGYFACPAARPTPERTSA